MGIEALLSTQIIDTTTVGRAVMTAADAAAARTAIGAGTSSFSGAYSALSGIPSTFAPSAHKTSHATGGSDALTASDIGAAATSHTHAAADITSGTIATARLASGTADSTTYLRGDQTWQAIAAGVGGSTGAVDNAVLRADGTGGSTVQASNWLIADNYTASPNNTVNHASIQATGSTTNVSVSIVPKGSGAFCLSVPDGTATGGNSRGANAIDLQTSRTAATQVASGAQAVAAGVNSTASATNGIAIGNAAASTGSGNGRSVAVGFQATASAEYAIAIGASASATGSGTICISNENGSASGNGATAIGPAVANASGGCSLALGGTATASRTNELAFGFRHTLFDVRPGAFLLSCKTTDANFTALAGNNVFQSSIAWTTRSGTVIQGVLQVIGVKSDGSAVASYTRKVIFKNVGGTITLVQSETIGTDYEDNASTDIEITNATPFFRVKGIASETWRWSGWFGPTLEMAYGT